MMRVDIWLGWFGGLEQYSFIPIPEQVKDILIINLMVRLGGRARGGMIGIDGTRVEFVPTIQEENTND